MDWQANEDSWTGEQPSQDHGLPGRGHRSPDPGDRSPDPVHRLPRQEPGLTGLPATGFDHGGPWAEAAPSVALVAALERAAGPEDRYEDANTNALVGIARQWAAVESWAVAGKLAALRAMTREDASGTPLLRRRSDLPDGWDDSLTYEISGALAMGPVSAGNLASLAWTLGTRLAETGRLLAAGTLTLPKARLIAQLFEPLDEREAARAEALILGELAGKTYPQVERLAWRAALAVAPDIAERGRAAAEKRARVTVFREDSGAVAASATAGPVAAPVPDDEGGGSDRTGDRGDTDGNGPDASGGPGPDDGLDGDGGAASRDSGGGPGSPRGDGNGNDQSPGSNGEPGPDDEGDGGAGGWEDPQPLAARLTEVTVPLATLQGQAARAGDSRLLGALDPALARDLATAAARSPASRWEVIVVDEHGYATGHGIARPARGPSDQPQPPPGSASSALSARVSITITETYLHQLEAQVGQPRSGAPPPGNWSLTPRNPGTWELTLPGGQQLAVRFDAVPVYDCDHRYRVSSYLPGDRLRRLIQIRDHTCTWPPCSRAARDSDFEHAIPYDKGGVTDACNAGARSRRCHQVKQLPGWSVTQPKPGWHVWTTPTGRTYTQEPWRYTA